MDLLIDTCVLPRACLQEALYYPEHTDIPLGFELLPMFDLPDFQDNLEANLSVFQGRPLVFHEPVWGVEHTAPMGTHAYDASMYHILLTLKYARILRPTHMVYHLNNCRVDETSRKEMLATTLENLEEMKFLFDFLTIVVENTGTVTDKNRLLDQDEFTDLCIKHEFDVLIDVGHANANGWDLPKLITDLKTQIRGFHLHNNDGIHDLHSRLPDGTLNFDTLMPFIAKTVPDAFWVIEYTRPLFHKEALLMDIRRLDTFRKMGEIKE